LSTMCIVKELAKKPEQVGEAYAKKQGKFYRMKLRQMLKDGIDKDEYGNKIEVVDSGDEVEEVEEVEEKYVPSRTYEEFRECAILKDLFGCLDLVPFQTYDLETLEKQYKRQAIMFHPDKAGEEATDVDREIWLTIKKAYETIIDLPKKRRYESTLPFDESYPEKGDWKNDDEFYKLWDACFINNSRFAVDQPAPMIGDNNTPMAEVRKFYKYWDQFKTWREFSQHHKHNPSEANDRAEKRWMESENKKTNKHYDKIERKRLIELIEHCYDNDPRIQRELKEEQDAKDKIKA
jgi:hypothetical protein